MEATLVIPESNWERMRAHVAAAAPEEACGLVSGSGSIARRVIPIENTLHSETRFRMEPGAQIKALMEIDARAEKLLAIYHSHPRGPNHPSETDITEATFPEALSLIWYPHDGEWTCRGYVLSRQGWEAVQIRIDSGM